ncbi:MAG: hypothetical protein A2275_14465 [Bacteroidetes bacterium RIFOXYA12_FULL_35_11]|nr:MAG: hypothetical protein A2X01_08740 [Bacteroidetes bacterium GWF2_35_48]OFY74729.1 MAG: hypothetical protein A2275_14465 [Bacteroidetes bacterium RIFOXYA12_FULL_35_11]OFZ02461.1 MAG: hypothetical protein A2491_11210 [Bacteroidetes bacterium RIFOXYC12_FULL_35_7]HBX52495.1 hypothetical protein [Bacteroidales bacterium]
MKTSLSVLILFLLVGFNYAQNCVNLFEGADFGITGTNAQITALAVDASGNKWLGVGGLVLSHGLAKYNGSTWTTYTYSAINQNTIPSNRVNGIAFDGSGNIWVATLNGVGKLTGTNWTRYNTTSGLPANNTSCIAVDENGVVWVGTNSGVARYNGSWTTYTTSNGLPDNTINCIYAKGTEVWVGTNSGAAKFTGSAWLTFSSPQGLPNNNVNAIFIDATYNKWFGTLSGLAKFDNVNIDVYNAINSGLPQVNVKAIIQDNDENIWVSTSAGLTLFDGQNWTTYHKNNSGLPDNDINPLAYEIGNDKIWFGYSKLVGSDSNASLGNFYYIPSLGLNILASNGFTFCNGDSTVLSASAGFTEFNWNFSALNHTSPTVIFSQADTVMLAAGNTNNCFDYDTTVLNILLPYNNQQICLATVSNVSGKNLVIWEKIPNVGTAFFNVYRKEFLSLNYTLIGTVPFNDIGIFVDTASQPSIRSERYRISVIDTCGNESSMSDAHKTLKLALSAGIGNHPDLNVELYDGILTSNYQIWRGTDTSNMQLYLVRPITNLLYSDTGVLVGQHYLYQIRIDLESICAPSSGKEMGGPFSQSLSNIEDNGIIDPGSISQNSENIMLVNISPNPFSDKTTIYFMNKEELPNEVNIYNSIGQHVRKINDIHDNNIVIEKGNLSRGFYFLKISGTTSYWGKIIIQ